MFEIKIKNKTNKIIYFLKSESSFNYSYLINNRIILPNNYFIIKFKVIKDIPIIANLLFSNGIYEIRNYLQTYDGESIFIFNGTNRNRMKIIKKYKFKPKPLLPQIYYIESIFY